MVRGDDISPPVHAGGVDALKVVARGADKKRSRCGACEGTNFQTPMFSRSGETGVDLLDWTQLVATYCPVPSCIRKLRRNK